MTQLAAIPRSRARTQARLRAASLLPRQRSAAPRRAGRDHTRRHRVGRLLSWILALFTLTLCGATAFAQTASGQTIVLWHAYRGEEQAALEQVVASYRGARVELLSVPYDAYAAKLGAAVPLGEGPDLFIDAHERLGSFRERGVVALAGDALGASPEAAFEPQALRAVTLGGEVWGVPLSQKCVALYFNRDLVAEPAQSIAGLAASLKAPLAKGSYLLAYENNGTYGHSPLLGAFGGQLLTDDDQFGMLGPAAEASLSYAKQLVDDGIVPPSTDGALVTRLFRGGQAAYAVSGPWLASDLGDGKLRYGVALLPKVDATGKRLTPPLTVEALMLSPHGAKRPEVRALARHIASRQGAMVRMRLARTVSARRDVEVPAGDEFLQLFRQQAQLAQPMPASVAMRAVWEPVDYALRKVMNGHLDPAAALAEAKHRFDDVRRPPPPPASPTPVLVLLGALCMLGAWQLWRRMTGPGFRAELSASWPAYRYLIHAVVVVGLLVFVPLIAGAAISLYAGPSGSEHYVGFANFADILRARGGPLLSSGSFYLVLLVTILWTVVNLTLHLGLGMLLGLLLSRPVMRLRAVYRVLLIVPWAVPNYVTALAWKGMFHRQFGAVTALTNRLNDALGLSMEPIAWFSQFSTAFTANVATNVWLGFPFMMVVTMAAVTAVPKEVLEAAEVDGASRWQRFRLVTLPLLWPSMLPAAALGAIWTFNMFNVVFLVSGGAPDGQTDILVSEAYRWAFTRQAQYGYAAAYSVLIFLLLFGATRLPSWIGAYRKARDGARAAVTPDLEAAA